MKKLAWMLIPLFALMFAFSFAVNTSADQKPPVGQYTCCSPGATYQGVTILTYDPPFWVMDCECDPPQNPYNCPLNCN